MYATTITWMYLSPNVRVFLYIVIAGEFLYYYDEKDPDKA